MNYKNLSYLALLLILVIACKSDRKVDDGSSDAETDASVEKKYQISPFSASTNYPDAELSNMTYQNGTFNFDVVGSEYKLGEQTPDAESKMCANSAKGQHIHLIIDAQPYAAYYTANFEHEVSDGTHHLLAFLSRSYHESLKHPEASIAQKITVKEGTIESSEDITDPMLFYSRPKGTYVGDDTKKIMVDFYPLNVELGDEYMVKLQVNGEVTMLDEWQPYFVENLPMGQNTIGLALVYPDGSAVPGDQTSILQTITLREDPAPQ